MGNVGIDFGGFDAAMAQQVLDDAGVGASLHQMRGIGVAQRMQRDGAPDASPAGGLFHHHLQAALAIRFAGVLALKQNQGGLHQQVAAHCAPLLAQPAAHQQRDKGHGRDELRRVWVSQHWPLVDAGADWPGLQTVVCQQITRWVAGKAQQATRYFLASLAGGSAATLAGCVRGHRGIEKQPHWHLDGV